jgi:uncharacterized protein YlxP (DUF503 family)
VVVGVAIFELHIPSARSLKEKRMVVRSVRDRLRQNHSVSAAEVALHDLHQRARIGVAIVSSDAASAGSKLESISRWIEEASEARLVGWTEEILPFDASVPLGIPHVQWSFPEQIDEEEP